VQKLQPLQRDVSMCIFIDLDALESFVEDSGTNSVIIISYPKDFLLHRSGKYVVSQKIGIIISYLQTRDKSKIRLNRKPLPEAEGPYDWLSTLGIAAKPV
jgi:hypothetical protein